jgi:hypothetical protein
MGRKTIFSVVALTIGLVGLGFVAGIQQRGDLDDLSGGMVALLAAVAIFAFLLVFVSTSVLLSTVLPTPGYRPGSRGEGRLGGILIAFPLVIALANAWVGDADRSPLYILFMMLNVLGAATAFWFLCFCVAHLFAHNSGPLVMVLWVVLLLLGSVVTMPLYWYLYVWRPFVALPSGQERSGRAG